MAKVAAPVVGLVLLLLVLLLLLLLWRRGRQRTPVVVEPWLPSAPPPAAAAFPVLQEVPETQPHEVIGNGQDDGLDMIFDFYTKQSSAFQKQAINYQASEDGEEQLERHPSFPFLVPTSEEEPSSFSACAILRLFLRRQQEPVTTAVEVPAGGAVELLWRKDNCVD